MKEKFMLVIKKINVKKIFNDFKSLIKNNLFLWIFILSSLVNSVVLRLYITNDTFKLRATLVDLVFLSIISIFYFFKKNKTRFRYILTFSIIMTAICIINSVYYTYYDSFASVSLLATSLFVVDVGDAVVKNVLEIKDFVFLWQPIFMIYIHSRLIKKNYIAKPVNENKKTNIFSFGLIGGIATILFVCSANATEWSRFTKLWNRVSVVSSFGVYTYQVNDIVQSLKPKINNLFGYDKALKKVKDYYKENSYESVTNKYSGIFEGKNIITIHAESIQEIAMELSFNEQEVTPNLNKLAREGLFFSNFYSQVGVGTSSDAEFTFATSLMPSSSGTVFVSYFNDKFETIQGLLNDKNYYVFSMHANNGDFWNRATMHKNMGYDKFFSKEYYDIDETIGLGLSDKSFFKQVTPIIKNVREKKNQLTYTNLIMLSNHTPFSDNEMFDDFPTTMNVDINGTSVTRDYINGTPLGDYFKSVHYADQAIGDLITNLDEAGLLENTVIVIYGDHDARINKKYYNILNNYDPVNDVILTEDDEGYIDYNEYEYKLDSNVPFIIWTKDKKYVEEVKIPMGMIDILPTLGNMLNIHSKYQLGSDIFNIKDGDNTVVFTDGSYVTSKIYYNGQNGEVYSINGDAVNETYISDRSKKASSMIEISNDIITYDLIRKIEDSNKKG